MKVKNLDHLNLSVKNLKSSIEWYSNLFGFEVVEKGIDDNIAWSIVKSGEAMLCLYEKPSFRFVDNNERRKKKIHGINHFSLRIEDRQQWEEVTGKYSPKLYYGGAAIHYPHSLSWYVQDPNGYEIEVVLWNDDQITF